MLKKQIGIILPCLITIFLSSCVTTNVPDEFEIIHETEPIIAYQNYPHYYFRKDVIPELDMVISFWYNFYGYYYNTCYQKVMAELFLTKQYEKLYIKEVSYTYDNKKYNLIKNKNYIIPTIGKTNRLLINYKEGEALIINGKNYYWIRVNLKKIIGHHFINGFLGQEKEIEIIQIYSFDDEPL